MRRVSRTITVVFASAVLAAFVWYGVHALHGHDLSVYANPRALGGLLVMVVLYVAAWPLDGLGWCTLLRGVGEPRRWREATAILGVAQIGKYLPGNVGQYLGRAAMALPRGISARAVAVTTVIELLLSVGAAVTVGVGAGLFSRYGRAIEHDNAVRLLAIALLLVAVVAGLYIVQRHAGALARRFLPQRASAFANGPLPAWRSIVLAFLLYATTFALIGFGFAHMTRLVLPARIHHDWLLGAAFALAWVVGFITPGAPAGLGVREALLILMLAPAYPPSYAVIAVIALRIATTVGDGVTFGLGWILRPRAAALPRIA